MAFLGGRPHSRIAAWMAALLCIAALVTPLTGLPVAEENENEKEVPSLEATSGPNITYHAWAKTASSFQYPEEGLVSVSSRPNAAIAFTGGGVRSYLATLGYLAGFQQLGLLDNVRYLAGVSGGSWGLTSYYYSTLSKGNDTQLLGPVMRPKDMTIDKLKAIDPGCLRAAPVNHNFEVRVVENFLNPFVKAEDVWFDTVNEVLCKPNGVADDKIPVIDQDTLDLILQRNPTLTASDFVLQRPNRPFMLLGGTYLGPKSLSPFDTKARMFTSLEMTPFYVGESNVQTIKYTASKHGKTEQHLVGGYVETFAFGADAPATGLSSTFGSLSSTQPMLGRLSPAHLTTISSFAPAGLLSDLPKFTIGELEPIYNMWSPAKPVPENVPGVLGDGGVVQNIPLINLLQRRVENIVLFFNNNQALNSTFDPKSRPVKTTDMSDDLPTFFGLNPDPNNDLWDLNNNQVFAKEDFAGVVNGLTTAQKAGKGTLYTTTLTTVANKWYGIDAGFNVHITFVYLSRTLAWENLLPADLRKEVQPTKGASNPTNVAEHGEFKNFPNISTYTQMNPSAQLANLLADMCGWVVLNNADAFRKALGAP